MSTRGDSIKVNNMSDADDSGHAGESEGYRVSPCGRDAPKLRKYEGVFSIFGQRFESARVHQSRLGIAYHSPDRDTDWGS